MTAFPTLSTGQDSSKFTETAENPALANEMEGGYVISRRRHTRTPRRTYTTAFTDVSEADRLVWNAFWDAVGGGSLAFDWTHPVTLEVKSVRFAKGSAPKIEYKGVGGNHRWNITGISLEEV